VFCHVKKVATEETSVGPASTHVSERSIELPDGPRIERFQTQAELLSSMLRLLSEWCRRWIGSVPDVYDPPRTGRQQLQKFQALGSQFRGKD
jgi:hypothetical protein